MSLHLDKEKVVCAIQRIESLDLRTTSIDDIEAELGAMLKGYRVCAPRLDAGIRLYRGRICDKPRNLSDIIYPPARLITCYGRANDIGEQILYATTGKSAVFHELPTRVGDYIAMGRWRSTGKMLLNHIGFTDQCKASLNSARDLDQLYDFVAHMRDFGQTNDLLHAYLASKFITPVGIGEEWKYKISIAIGHILLTGNRIDGIMYPTVAMQGNVDNIAIKSACVSRYLVLEGVEFVRVIDKRGGSYSYEIIDSATKVDDHDYLIWAGDTTKGITCWKSDEPPTTSNQAGFEVSP